MEHLTEVVSGTEKSCAEALLARLRDQEVLHARGYQVEIGGTGDVVISRWGHVRGVWSVRDGVFGWIVGGSREAGLTTGDLEEAVAYAIEHILVP